DTSRSRTSTHSWVRRRRSIPPLHRSSRELVVGPPPEHLRPHSLRRILLSRFVQREPQVVPVVGPVWIHRDRDPELRGGLRKTTRPRVAEPELVVRFGPRRSAAQPLFEIVISLGGSELD